MKIIKPLCFSPGLRWQSINIHHIKHLVTLTRKFGPLWAVSCFPFESMNHLLRQLIHGTGHVLSQVGSLIIIFFSIRLKRKEFKLKRNRNASWCSPPSSWGVPQPLPKTKLKTKMSWNFSILSFPFQGSIHRPGKKESLSDNGKPVRFSKRINE